MNTFQEFSNGLIAQKQPLNDFTIMVIAVVGGTLLVIFLMYGIPCIKKKTINRPWIRMKREGREKIRRWLAFECLPQHYPNFNPNGDEAESPLEFLYALLIHSSATRPDDDILTFLRVEFSISDKTTMDSDFILDEVMRIDRKKVITTINELKAHESSRGNILDQFA
jgi:hypothetical protein